jgi:hypothetical protein
MKPGIGLQLAPKDMDRVSRELQVQYSENAQLGTNVVPIQVGLRRRCGPRLVGAADRFAICPANRLFEPA